MQRRPLMLSLVVALIASAVVMVSGVNYALPWLSVTAAALFAALLLASGLNLNRAWRDAAGDDPAFAARENARLLALAYAWGGVAMFSAYTFSSLRWYHAYQYGAAMLLLALIAAAYSLVLGRKPAADGKGSTALTAGTVLVGLQAVAALAGVIFLVASGKIASGRSDWLANQVFLFGGLMIAGLSAMAAITQRRLLR